MADAPVSWLTRILDWFLSWSRKRDAQQALDTAAITRNQEAAHAVEIVEDRPVVPVATIGQRLRDGKF